MDNRKRKSNPNPREKANIFSVLTWAWTINLFKKGYCKILEAEDLYDPLNKDKSNALGDRLEKQWFVELEKAKRKNRNPKLLYAIFYTFAPEIILSGLVQIINEVFLRLGTPFLLGAFLQCFKTESNMSSETALYYATSMLAATFLSTTLLNQTIFIGYHVGGRARIAACSLIYRKALRLSKMALGETAPGKIVNLLASDVSRFDSVFTQLHYMWSAPLLAIVVTILMYRDIGWSAFVGMSIVFLVILFQGYLGQLASKFRLETSLKTDKRIRLMDEIISGVRVIKMYAWEKPFCSLVEFARRLELKIVEKNSYVSGIYMTFYLFTTRMALYGTLITMLLRGQQLNAEKIFIYISYLNTISITMSIMFARGIVQTADCYVAINRMQCFLMHDEFESKNIIDKSLETDASNARDTKINSDVGDDVHKSNSNFMQANGESTDVLKKRRNSCEYKNVSINESCSIKLTNVNAKWNSRLTDPILKDITLEIEKGKLYIVIGMVGTGKSSFMSVILGELKFFQGNVDVKGCVSYADQDAWVFGASVRENILFGQKFDKQKYEKVIKACALQKDFQQFPQGDQRIVGERGGTLSGGQKARINLARAIYREADVYLLDDPLSAVDTHVGKHLFQECIQNYLAGKTRILATHQLQYIEGADVILLLDQGKIYQFADYHELLQAQPKYSTLIGAAKENRSVEETLQNPYVEKKHSLMSVRNRSSESCIEINSTEKTNETKHNAFFESSSRGTVKGSLFLTYIRSGASGTVAFTMLLLYVATQVCVNLNDYYIPVLVEAEESRNHNLQVYNNFSIIQNISEGFFMEEDILPRNYYIYIYTGLITSIFLLGITRSFVFYKTCLVASQHLHDLAFVAIIRTKMLFFNSNPSGRILNRFSKDLGIIDELLPRAIHDASQCIIIAFGAILVTCTTNVWFLIPIVPIGALFMFIRMIYLKTSKNIKRLEGMTRSPVFTHLNATLNGITTIRAYQAENILKEEFDKLQDTHTSSWYMSLATTIAFGFSIDVCCFIFTVVVTFSFLLLKENFNDGVVGLAITQLLSLTSVLQWGMRLSAEVTNALTSVERVVEYSQLPSESNLRDKEFFVKISKKSKKEKLNENLLIVPPKEWPSEGCIKFINVFMRYTDKDPPVLKNLILTIRPSEKVGVVGRTGAGKSSLISTLFRLAEIEGVIEIDGFNTGTISLEDLRKHISIIPQDPVLFSGTLRHNLDPFNEFSDENLWKVLEEVELKDSVKLTGNGLDHRVLDRGSNYSAGQRQLICLARAILRNNRILMLDEATANVDPYTDGLIQRTIRTKFAPCTVLTVAHRLNTVMDSDKVLVMDKGQMVEFDHPYVLLQNTNGPFLSLVKETGKSIYEKLYRVAYDSYVNKFENTRL